MSRRRKTGIWWLLSVILVIGYFSRGRSRVEPVPQAPAAGVPVVRVPETPTPVRPPLEKSDSRRIAGRVVSVADGDTITVLDAAKTQYKVRLDAIDAPELGQPFGQASKKALSEMVFGQDVVVIRKTTDRYGRTVGHVLIDGRDVNLAMLEAGMAWHYKEYDKNKRLAAAEIAAKEAKIGLWRDGGAVAPWDWRAAARTKRKVASP
jgi:endonuclease YncB( thermonuclease family)